MITPGASILISETVYVDGEPAAPDSITAILYRIVAGVREASGVSVTPASTANVGEYTFAWTNSAEWNPMDDLELRAIPVIDGDPKPDTIWRSHGHAIPTMVAAAGPSSQTLTITAETDSESPVSGVIIDIAGRRLVTGTGGIIAQPLDPGTYPYSIIPAPGFSLDSADPASPIVIDASAVSLDLVLTAPILAAPDDPAACNVAVDVSTQYTLPAVGACCRAVATAPLPTASGALIVTEASGELTGQNGRAVLTLHRSTSYKITVVFEGQSYSFGFTTPNAPTAIATLQLG